MANYYSFLVTDKPFAVKDAEVFIKAIAPYATPLEADNADGLLFDQDKAGKFWLGGFDAGFPTGYDAHTQQEVDLLELIRQHLAEGECAVLKETGHEKLRYVVGTVYVVTPTRIDSAGIDEAAEELRRKLTASRGPRRYAVVATCTRDANTSVEAGFGDRMAALRRALEFVEDQLPQKPDVSEDADECDLEELLDECNESGPDRAEVVPLHQVS